MPYVESSQKNLSFRHMIYQMLALELNYSPPPQKKNLIQNNFVYENTILTWNYKMHRNNM